LWKEIIEKAKSDNLKSMVLITGDIKPDWWYVQSGKRLGPKKELLNEIYTEAPSLECFYMYDTSNFLKFAKEKLALNIQDSSIAEAKELIELDSINNTRENINIADFCREFSNNFIDLNVVIEKSLFDMPPINIRRNSFEGSIAEIYLNVLHHGYDNTVYITSELSKEESFLSIIFKNKHKNEAESAFDTVAQGSSRGHGRIAIKEWLAKQGIDFITYNNQGYYYFEMFIPKNLFST